MAKFGVWQLLWANSYNGVVFKSSKIGQLIFSPNVGFFLIITYVSFINLFVIKTTPELIFLQFAILVVLFRRFKSKKFLTVWVPFIALFVLYEWLRGYVDNVSPFYETTLYWVYDAESAIFGRLLTSDLQRIFSHGSLITQVSIFFYSMFFYFSFLIAFVVWLKREDKFRAYFFQFLVLTYVSLLVFFLVPTAPPWMVAQERGLEFGRYLAQRNILASFSYLQLYYYFVYGNPVAALPSLHFAWPFFSVLFLVKNFKNRFLYLLFVVPFMIAFSIVLTGEHYLIDILLSFLLVIAVVFGDKVFKTLSRLRLGST